MNEGSVTADSPTVQRPADEEFDPVAAKIRLDAERLRLVCRAVARTPLGVVPATAFVAYIMAPHVGAGRAWGWTAAMVAIWGTRAVICAVLLHRPPSAHRLRFWIRYLIASAAVSGMAGGAAAVLFFSAPPLENALMTMVLCCWCAAGIAVSGAVPLAFYGLVVFFLTPIALGWALSGNQDSLLVASLLVLFMFLLMTYARDGAELVGRALRVGFENEELARRLRARETEAQAARERAEAANLSKSRFLAAASHDLRQPLHALSLLLYTLQQRTRDPETSELLRRVATSADSLDSLFKGLLDLSRLDAGSVTPERRALSLEPLLKRLENDFRPLAAEKGLEFECASCDVWVKSDPEMLERVLRNLLDNAVKYTERGRIEIRLGEEPQEIRVMVCDNGIGIDPAHRDRIFEEYYQIRNPSRDRSKGIGLGLAIVKRMCDLLDHSIRLDSDLGRGSTFQITLPRCEPSSDTADDDKVPSTASIAALRGLVVVVIEDNTEVQDAMRKLLEGWACQPIVGASSEEVSRNLDSARCTPDVILADYRLAGSNTGIDAIVSLFARYGEIPAAIVTGEINAADLIPEGMSVAVMQKPVHALDIRDWLLMVESIP